MKIDSNQTLHSKVSKLNISPVAGGDCGVSVADTEAETVLAT